MWVATANKVTYKSTYREVLPLYQTAGGEIRRSETVYVCLKTRKPKRLCGATLEKGTTCGTLSEHCYSGRVKNRDGPE